MAVNAHSTAESACANQYADVVDSERAAGASTAG